MATPTRPYHRHGRSQFFIEGEGPAPAAMLSPRQRKMAPAATAAMEAAEPPEDPKRAFRFCRLFPDLAKFQPDDAGLIALGQALEDPFMPGAGDSLIPGGFTYLGQFVDHDITFDRTEGIPTGPSIPPRSCRGGRRPWSSTACTAAAPRSRPSCTSPTGDD